MQCLSTVSYIGILKSLDKLWTTAVNWGSDTGSATAADSHSSTRDITENLSLVFGGLAWYLLYWALGAASCAPGQGT